MQWFRDRGLNVKMAFIVSAVLVVFLLIGGGLLLSSFDNFTTSIGQQRAASEVAFVQERIAEIEAEVLLSADVLADNPALIDAVGTADERALGPLLLRSIGLYNADQISVVDTDRTPVMENAALGTIIDGEQPLISLALLGTDITGIVSETTGDSVTVRLVASVPLKNRAGAIIGALLVGRDLDDNFWNTANFNRDAVSFVLLADGHVAAQTANTAAFNLSDLGVTENNDAVAQAMNNRAVIGDAIAVTENGTSLGVAYVPLEAGGRVGAVLVALADVSENFQLRDTIFQTLTVAFVLLSLAMLATIVFTARQAFAAPLLKVQTVAQEMLDGDYSQRVAVNSADEVGQLGKAFNAMAVAIEYRDNEQIAQLETRLVDVQEAREVAERSDEVKSAFLASMSHELRTPLNAVINFTKFVAQGDLGPVNDDQEETLYEVVDSAKHLLNLINDVLDMSKMESGSLSLFIADEVDLTGILNQGISTTRSLIGQKPIEIQTNIAADLPHIRADRQRIFQVMLNILSNASKFTDEGVITVRAYHDAGQVTIAVTDTGSGIAAEDQWAVFEAFKQTTSGLRQGGGTGLGMPITKNLVEAHDGRIELASQLGEGTTFTITLPIKSDTLTPTLIS